MKSTSISQGISNLIIGTSSSSSSSSAATSTSTNFGNESTLSLGGLQPASPIITTTSSSALTNISTSTANLFNLNPAPPATFASSTSSSTSSSSASTSLNFSSSVANESLFSGGFISYLENGLYSDIKLIVGGKHYNVHRMIIGHSSQYFRRLFDSGFQERDKREIELKFEDCGEEFPVFLRYLYEGNIELNEANSIPLMALSDRFLVEKLKNQCLQFLEKTISRDTCLNFLKQGIAYHMEDVHKRCLRVIAKNFHSMYNLDFWFMPLSIFLELLEHPALAVKTEYTVYVSICNYIEGRQEQLSPEDIQKLFENVRFPFFTLKQLEKAEGNGVVPRFLIIEGLMARLKKVELPEDEYENQIGGIDRLPIRMTPRDTIGIEFQFHHDFDQGGILYYIATNGGTENFENPSITLRVKMTSSSIEKGHPNFITDYREPRECWTRDVPASWFQLDLGPSRKVIPNYYTLRHGGNYRADSLRNWDFQGSLDAKTWMNLRRHNNDQSLNGNFATQSWPIVTENLTAYRYFRILQKGHNSSDRNFMLLSGLEIYGELFESNDNYNIFRRSSKA